MSRFSLALAAVLAAAPLAAAEPYKDAGRHFAFALPAGWGPMPADELQTLNDFIAGRNVGAKVRYTAAFRPAGAPRGSYPYVLVQPLDVPTAGASYDDIERELGKEMTEPLNKVEGALADVGKNLALGSAVLDRTNNRFVTRMQMEVAGVGPVQGLTVGHIGADGIVCVHGYATAPNFDARLPTFNALNESFRFDAGHAFVPGSGRSIWKNALNGGMNGAVVGGGVGVLAGVGLMVAKLVRKKPKPLPLPEEDEIS